MCMSFYCVSIVYWCQCPSGSRRLRCRAPGFPRRGALYILSFVEVLYVCSCIYFRCLKGLRYRQFKGLRPSAAARSSPITTTPAKLRSQDICVSIPCFWGSSWREIWGPLTFSSAVKTFQWLLSDSVNTFSVHGTGLQRPLIVYKRLIVYESLIAW